LFRQNLRIVLVLLLTQSAFAQCDRTIRDQIVYASLAYFQDSINSHKSQILLLDSTQFSINPSFTFEPGLFNVLPDTLTLMDLSIALKKTIKYGAFQSELKHCPRIKLISSDIILQALNNDADWRNFYKVNPNVSGYYSTVEPIVVDNFALIYVENFCGNLCGSGYIMYLSYNEKLKNGM
jgi:hypothetical protein